MSVCSDNYYEQFEYNPCIRKGKHKPIYKKQKKYEAKIQKTNLIQPKRAKLVNYLDSIINSQLLLNQVVEILKKKSTDEWNDEYEYIYSIYRLSENEELSNNYKSIQSELEEREYYDNYDDYDDCQWYKYDRFFR
jgi:hypothetical protein